MIEPFRLNEPMILTGLDTVILGNIDHLMTYCYKAEKIALPIDPNHPHTICNGVALVPRGHGHVYHRWNGGMKYLSDMECLRAQDYSLLDNLFPGEILSYKCHVLKNGLRDARIVYFHGKEKMHELPDVDWITENWQ